MAGKSPRSETRPPTSRLEWTAAGLGAAILAAILGYMTWYGITQPEGSPLITVTAEAVHRSGDGFLVEFAARNHGSATAAAVTISGTLADGDRVAAEQSRAEIDYLPQRSQRRGGLLFSRDPMEHSLALRVEGFTYP